MFKNLPEKISDENILSCYQKLLMLKKAVTMGENEEVSERILLDRAREHNEQEIYLIGYLVDAVMNAPKEVREQFDLLISCYDNPKEYEKVYKRTEKMFITNLKFRRYSAKIFAHLDLFTPFNCKLTNLTIFGLCPELISNIVQLDPENIIMNFHILQKWLGEQRQIVLSKISIIEQKVVLYLANGYSPKNILDEYDDVLDEDISRLKSIIYKVLPARCNVQSICQVMAVMFMSNPDLADIHKAIKITNEFFDDEL